MIPLWTTTISPVRSRCGWAFSSVGALRGPARVPDTVYAVERIEANRFLKVRSLPELGESQLAVVPDDRDAGRIVTAILESSKAVQDQRYHSLLVQYIRQFRT